MTEFTKRLETHQHTEWIYYRDGQEIAREENYDDHAYDIGPVEPMSEEEIEDFDDRRV